MLDIRRVSYWDYIKECKGELQKNKIFSPSIIRSAQSYDCLFRDIFIGSIFQNEEGGWGKHKLLENPLYGAFLRQYDGRDPEGIHICDSGVQVREDDEIFMVTELYRHIRIGLMLIDSVDWNIPLYLDILRGSLDSRGLNFFAAQEKTYKVYVSIFADLSSWLIRDGIRGFDGITIDGEPVSNDLLFHLPDFTRDMKREYILASHKEYLMCNQYEYDNCLFCDISRKISMRDFLMLLARRAEKDVRERHSSIQKVLSDIRDLPEISYETMESYLECAVCGNQDLIMEYGVVLHDNIRGRAFGRPKYPGKFCYTKTKGEVSFQGDLSMCKYPSMESIVMNLIEYCESSQVDSAMLLYYDMECPCIFEDGFCRDILENVTWYIEVNRKDREAALFWGKNPCGRRHFMEEYFSLQKEV